MELIDDEGRLFGRVNVIDALVVLLIAAVVVAGAAFVLTDDPAPAPEMNTTYATLDIGTVSPYVVDAIEEGDAYDPDGASTLRITDVHLTPQGDDTRVVLRWRLRANSTTRGASRTQVLRHGLGGRSTSRPTVTRSAARSETWATATRSRPSNSACCSPVRSMRRPRVT